MNLKNYCKEIEEFLDAYLVALILSEDKKITIRKIHDEKNKRYDLCTVKHIKKHLAIEKTLLSIEVKRKEIIIRIKNPHNYDIIKINSIEDMKQVLFNIDLYEYM